jgi:hypothetical protein
MCRRGPSESFAGRAGDASVELQRGQPPSKLRVAPGRDGVTAPHGAVCLKIGRMNSTHAASPISSSTVFTTSSSLLADMIIDRDGDTSSQSLKKSARQVNTSALAAKISLMHKADDAGDLFQPNPLYPVQNQLLGILGDRLTTSTIPRMMSEWSVRTGESIRNDPHKDIRTIVGFQFPAERPHPVSDLRSLCFDLLFQGL